MSRFDSGAAIALVAGAVLVASTVLVMQALGAAPVAPVAAALGNRAACAAYSGLPPGWGSDPRAGMQRLPGGRFVLGAADGYPEERPVREATAAPFWIDRTEVTNAQYDTFVRATGYVTEGERNGSGAVFRAPPAGRGEDVAYGSWWHAVRGADWRHPEGPGSSLRGRENQPVVQLTRADAAAYARWLGRSLPTEAQWEYAARAGGQGERIERGPRGQDGQPAANFWQGIFPYLDSREDGYADRAPVGCYPANGMGLHDMIGNVWEWTADRWHGDHQPHGTGAPAAISADEGLIKGGSFLCASDFCTRYRASARHPQDTALGAVHVGFRTVSPAAL
ncbi:formylglycine-generating enzyme family protein [Pseudoduganella lutea]|uniref:Formylglycine-generating enzyme family protein n=1 Tax=Pseudoduganella lutea TaxID=321985 RepID=A0A4P6L7U2_9BURK|nr:formylglycine-generating enzyme family protein [Pseudoduganella lutea]QBE67022.1 formylglycine-generating enzyme family protein [Pseudoduganella lutea]